MIQLLTGDSVWLLNQIDIRQIDIHLSDRYRAKYITSSGGTWMGCDNIMLTVISEYFSYPSEQCVQHNIQ